MGANEHALMFRIPFNVLKVLYFSIKYADKHDFTNIQVAFLWNRTK